MHYTIASIKDVQGVISVNFAKHGNGYMVYIHNRETHECTHRDFTKLNTAYDVFERLSRAIIMGNYNYEQRKQILEIT